MRNRHKLSVSISCLFCCLAASVLLGCGVWGFGQGISCKHGWLIGTSEFLEPNLERVGDLFGWLATGPEQWQAHHFGLEIATLGPKDFETDRLLC